MDNITRRDKGLPYITDAAVTEEHKKARKLVQELNTADFTNMDEHRRITRELLGKAGENVYVAPPFYCDYGSHIEIGNDFFSNYNCTILDVAKVKIGNNVMFGPGVCIYTAGHPLHPVSRDSGYEYGIPVTIGNSVWIGGNSIVTPGVTIGDNVVIGAGSVVTKDIPANMVAAGNPCRIIREITDADKRYYYKDQEFDDEAWSHITGAETGE